MVPPDNQPGKPGNKRFSMARVTSFGLFFFFSLDLTAQKYLWWLRSKYLAICQSWSSLGVFHLFLWSTLCHYPAVQVPHTNIRRRGKTVFPAAQCKSIQDQRTIVIEPPLSWDITSIELRDFCGHLELQLHFQAKTMVSCWIY